MAAPYFCGRCGTEADEPLGKCPRCGRRLHKTSTIRGLGFALVVLGGGLTAGMAWLTFVVARIIKHSNDPGATSRFTGDASDALMVYAIFGLVIALGLAFVAGGVWQIVYGRRNKSVIFVALVLVAVLYAFGLFVRAWL